MLVLGRELPFQVAAIPYIDFWGVSKRETGNGAGACFFIVCDSFRNLVALRGQAEKATGSTRCKTGPTQQLSLR